MLNTVQEIIARFDDYQLEHGRYPLRVTVSQEVARELDAIISERREKLGESDVAAPKSRSGGVLTIRGVQVVADLDPQDTIDYR